MFDKMRRLHPRGAASRGICVDADGAMLGPDCVLVCRAPTAGFRAIDRDAASALQKCALAGDRDPDWLFRQCQRIAEALSKGELALAQIYGLYIPVAELDGRQLAKLAGLHVAKAGFNPDEPRIPKGAPHGGEWTTGGSDASAASSGPGRLAADTTNPTEPPAAPIGGAPTTLDSPDLQLDVSVNANRPKTDEGSTVNIPGIGEVNLNDLPDFLAVLAARGGGKPSSRRLGRNMERSANPRPEGFVAHHVVAKDARAAKPAQAVLQRFGIHLDDAVNGGWLPSEQHESLHRVGYYEAVNDILGRAASKAEAEALLQSIGGKLKERVFP